MKTLLNVHDRFGQAVIQSSGKVVQPIKIPAILNIVLHQDIGRFTEGQILVRNLLRQFMQGIHNGGIELRRDNGAKKIQCPVHQMSGDPCNLFGGPSGDLGIRYKDSHQKTELSPIYFNGTVVYQVNDFSRNLHYMQLILLCLI